MYEYNECTFPSIDHTKLQKDCQSNHRSILRFIVQKNTGNTFLQLTFVKRPTRSLYYHASGYITYIWCPWAWFCTFGLVRDSVYIPYLWRHVKSPLSSTKSISIIYTLSDILRLSKAEAKVSPLKPWLLRGLWVTSNPQVVSNIHSGSYLRAIAMPERLGTSQTFR